MQRKKYKLLVACSSLILSLLALVGSAYAWFVVKSDANDLGFQILQIDSQINVFQGDDINSNGVLDQLKEEEYGTYYVGENTASYERTYYTEKNKFEFIDSKYALSATTAANTISNFTLTDMAPSKIYTIKFEITNYSAFENTMTFKYMSDTYTSSELARLSAFQSRIGTVDSLGKVTYESEWLNLTNDDGTYDGCELTSSITISQTGSNAEDGRLDCWLQIKIKDDASYDAFDGISSMSFPDYNIILTMSGSD